MSVWIPRHSRVCSALVFGGAGRTRLRRRGTALPDCTDADRQGYRQAAVPAPGGANQKHRVRQRCRPLSPEAPAGWRSSGRARSGQERRKVVAAVDEAAVQAVVERLAGRLRDVHAVVARAGAGAAGPRPPSVRRATLKAWAMWPTVQNGEVRSCSSEHVVVVMTRPVRDQPVASITARTRPPVRQHPRAGECRTGGPYGTTSWASVPSTRGAPLFVQVSGLRPPHDGPQLRRRSTARTRAGADAGGSGRSRACACSRSTSR